MSLSLFVLWFMGSCYHPHVSRESLPSPLCLFVSPQVMCCFSCLCWCPVSSSPPCSMFMYPHLGVKLVCVFESLCLCYFLFYFDSVSPCIQYSVHSVLLPLSRYLSLLCSHVPPLSPITLLCIYCVGFPVVPCQVICSYPPVSLFLRVSQFRLAISWVV